MVLNNVLAVLRYLVPVDNVPPVGNIFGPAVLVFEVVSVLPDIQSKNREHDTICDALHERIILVGGVDELKLVTLLVDAHPDPSRAKGSTRCGQGLELLLHLIHGSERLVDESRQLRGWLHVLALVRGSHFFPEERMVVVAAAAVANRSSFQGICHEVEDWDLFLTFAVLVDVGDISSMVLVVVELHGRSINVRLKGLERVWKIGDEISTGNTWSSEGGTGGKGLAEDVTAASSSRVWN
jgi:hypothetical protein